MMTWLSLVLATCGVAFAYVYGVSVGLKARYAREQSEFQRGYDQGRAHAIEFLT